VLIGKFDQKSKFQLHLVWTRPYKSRMGPHWEKTRLSRAGSIVT